MRRDYFTCVFLGLIAGALTFVCFKPLYFTWDQIIPRDFTTFERLMSVLYTLFFIFFLPFFAAFKKKEWIHWGLAAYGLLAYFPLWFYPAPELIKGDNADMLHIFGSLCLRAIYAVMQAPSQRFQSSSATMPLPLSFTGSCRLQSSGRFSSGSSASTEEHIFQSSSTP